MTLLNALKPHVQLGDPWKKKAWAALEAMGLPTKKWSAFKYVPLSELATSTFAPHSAPLPDAEGAVSLSLQEAARTYGALLQKSDTENLAAEKSPFALLNRALYTEGQFLYVPPGKSVELAWDFSLSSGLRAPRVEIFVGKGSTLKICSKWLGKGTYFFNPYFQLTLDRSARVTIDEHLEHTSTAFAMHTVRARLKRDAHLTLFSFTKGAQSERHDLQVTLMEEGSSVDLKGLSLLSRRDTVHHFIDVRHGAEHTKSSQHYKTALMDRGRSSFEGKIFVEKEAQKTEAYQLNNNLLLSPKAKAVSRPNLEIFADDVKASHGATATQPNEAELFYLQTRGLSLKAARRALARGFCRELMGGQVVDRFLQTVEDTEDV